MTTLAVVLVWTLTLSQEINPSTPTAAPTSQPLTYVQPDEGDMLFFSDRSFLWRLGYTLAWTAPPYHVGIVVRRPDGSLASFESGPDDIPWILIQDLEPRLRSYDGKIWVRKLRQPLCPQASGRLTQFSLCQEGKHFATFRLILAGTPLRHRGPIRARINTRPHGDRPHWFCSELVLEAAVVAAIIPWNKVRPSAAYPRDLFYDRWMSNLLPYYEPACRWSPAQLP